MSAVRIVLLVCAFIRSIGIKFLSKGYSFQRVPLTTTLRGPTTARNNPRKTKSNLTRSLLRTVRGPAPKHAMGVIVAVK